MVRRLLLLNHAVLFACTSIYLGTSWSLVHFHFQAFPQLTVDTYYVPFVVPVQAATMFFIILFNVMLVTIGVMLLAEWGTRFVWYAVAELVLTVGAATFTALLFFPYNDALAAGVTDPAELERIIGAWMSLHYMRHVLWTAMWGVMMGYFVHKVLALQTALDDCVS